MSEALSYILYIYQKMISLLFNDLEVDNGITIGWIIIVCLVFSIIIRSVVAIPSRGTNIHVGSSRSNN